MAMVKRCPSEASHTGCVHAVATILRLRVVKIFGMQSVYLHRGIGEFRLPNISIYIYIHRDVGGVCLQNICLYRGTGEFVYTSCIITEILESLFAAVVQEFWVFVVVQGILSSHAF